MYNIDVVAIDYDLRIVSYRMYHSEIAITIAFREDASRNACGVVYVREVRVAAILLCARVVLER